MESPITQMPRRESENSDSLFITPEAYKATEAVEFIAEHLRNEDHYIQVRRCSGAEGTCFISDRDGRKGSWCTDVLCQEAKQLGKGELMNILDVFMN